MNTSTSAAGSRPASIEQLVFRFAGVFVLASLALSQLHSIYWLWFTAFVGANMLQASFTGFCPLASILSRLGVKSGTAFCSRDA